MRRGEIWLADLEPARGSEAGKSRPVVVVSNDGANAAAERHGAGVVTIVPITSGLNRVYPFQVYLPRERTRLRANSKAQAEQVRSIDARRLSRQVGSVPPDLMSDLGAALRLHLAL
jgi:mRNA interferase MazF